MLKKIITWDLGATKCAAAVVEYHPSQQTLNCIKHTSVKIRDHHSLQDLTATLENLLETKMVEADAICIGAAGHYDGKALQLNAGYPYPMEFAVIGKEQNWPRFAIIHDYSPIVCATFTSYMEKTENIRPLNTAAINPLGRRIALGIGTGIGLKDGILFSNGDFWLGTNEIGHIGVTAPPMASNIHQNRHKELLIFLRSEGIISENEPLTFEKLLANEGIARIHAFFDRDAKNKSIDEIAELIQNGKAVETLATFAWYVGLLVGTVQLAFMPDGGIWMTGGVTLNYLDAFSHPDFLHGIEASPAYLNLRQTFPLGILCGTEHAFMGGAYYATKRLL